MSALQVGHLTLAIGRASCKKTLSPRRDRMECTSNSFPFSQHAVNLVEISAIAEKLYSIPLDRATAKLLAWKLKRAAFRERALANH
jgi:hypothetical protein